MEVAAVERAFIRLNGPDAESYLQGQLSQDVSTGGGLSLLLEPNGKLVALLRFGRDGDGFLLDTDVPALDATVARLRRFLLRTKVDIDVVDDRRLARAFGAPGPLPGAQIVAAWPDASVQDIIEPRSVERSFNLSNEAYERRRIEAGVPVSGVDIDADTIPAEAGRWVIDAAVSFTKGCYTGQELVARIDTRGGNVPRPLRVLRFGGVVAVGDDVLDADGTVAGHVTSAAGDVALARLARKVEPGAVIRAGAGGAEGVVER